MARRWGWLLLLTVGHILLVINRVNPSPAEKIIHIGYLRQNYENGGAINVAIENAHNDGLLRDYNFRYDCDL